MLVNSKILERLDISHEFWKKFDVCKPELYKHAGLYEIESIDNPNTITISINANNYLEKSKNKNLNKKHK